MMRSLVLAAFFSGFSVMAGQIILLREFLAVFFGNELTLGFILPFWMAWGAAGAWAGRSFSRVTGETKKRAVLAACMVAAAIFFLCALFCIRGLRPALGLMPGEIVPLFPAIAAGALILFPSCFLSGAVFSLICSFPACRGEGARFYAVESLGSALSGVLVGFFLIGLAAPVQILLTVTLLNLYAAWRFHGFGSRVLVRSSYLAGFALIALASYPAVADKAERKSLEIQWKGYELCDVRNSVYGRVHAVKRGGETSFFENGMRLFTLPDVQAEEESVQYCLLQHPSPRRVLLIGTGIGSLRQAAQHKVSLDYVQLDPELIRLQRRCLGETAFSALVPAGTGMFSSDGRSFIKRSAGGRYDCVILYSGDPLSCQLNRYYTLEFFREVERVLTPGGIFSFSCTGSESYLNPQARDFLGSLRLTLERVFADVKFIPGGNFVFLASNRAGTLSFDPAALEGRIRERSLEVIRVSPSYLPERLSPRKLELFEKALSGRGELNLDYRPIACMFASAYWSSHFRGSFLDSVTRALRVAGPVPLLSVWTAFCLVFVLLLRGRRPVLYWTAGVSGFSMIGFQVMIILAFQAMYGFMFYRLGLVMAVFMLGMFFGVAVLSGKSAGKDFLPGAQAVMAAYAFLLPLCFYLLTRVSPLQAEFLFFLLPLAAGALGGVVFAAITRRFLLTGEDVPGCVYATDLAGSCIGALLVSFFLVPFLGITLTALMISLLNLAMCAALLPRGAATLPLSEKSR